MAIVAGILPVLSMVNEALGIVQFGLDNFKAPEKTGSIVSFAIGLNYPGGLQEAGGSIPDVRLWNEAGAFLGMKADPGSIGNGEAKEVKVPHYEHNSGQQAAYSLFSGNNDAVCIAYMTITWPDGNRYAWDGSWAKECDGSWYHSHYKIKGTDIMPPCIWVDKDGDYPTTAFQIHWSDFVVKDGEKLPDPKSQAAKDKAKSICNSPAFKMYTDHDPNSITFVPLPPVNPSRRDTGLFRRKLGPSTPSKAAANKNLNLATNDPAHRNGTNLTPHLDRLVISNSTNHSVEELCKSKNSLGPDFLNVGEGKFCRMSDKTLWPICSKGVVDRCFNVESKQLVVGGKATRDTPYKDVKDWTGGQ